MRAQFVRIVVKEWYHHICLRVEFYGCQGKNVKISYAVIHIVFFRGGGGGGEEASILAFSYVNYTVTPLIVYFNGLWALWDSQPGNVIEISR